MLAEEANLLSLSGPNKDYCNVMMRIKLIRGIGKQFTLEKLSSKDLVDLIREKEKLFTMRNPRYSLLITFSRLFQRLFNSPFPLIVSEMLALMFYLSLLIDVFGFFRGKKAIKLCRLWSPPLDGGHQDARASKRFHFHFRFQASDVDAKQSADLIARFVNHLATVNPC